VLRPREVNRRFLHYFCLSADFIATVDASTYGTKMPRCGVDFIGHLLTPVPPARIQTAIADYLDRETGQLDALITKMSSCLIYSAEKRQSLISLAVTRGIDPAAPRKPSGIPWLGDIPKHWSARRLRFLVKGKLQYGANEATESKDPTWPRFVRITDIDEQGNLRPETFLSLPPVTALGYMLVDGDVLFARSGATVGKTFQYRPSWDGPAMQAI